MKKGGYIFIDDAYSVDDSNERYLSREQWNAIFHNAGLKLVDEKIVVDSELKEINKNNQDCIIMRANELKKAHPEKVDIFEGYIRSQQAECDELETELTGVTTLLQVYKC